MIRSPAPNPAPDAAAFALAMMGMVAALICLLSDRVLPRFGARMERADAEALLRVQVAMLGLAGAAWRGVEAPEAAPSRAMETWAAALHDAVAALALRASRRRPTARRPFAAPAPARRAAPPATRVVAARVGAAHPRDGPSSPCSGMVSSPHPGTGHGWRLVVPSVPAGAARPLCPRARAPRARGGA